MFFPSLGVSIPFFGGVTCLRPSILMFPASPLSFAVRAPPLQPSLAPAIPDRFLSPPHPCLYQNSFYCDLQLIHRCLLPPPWHQESPPLPCNPSLSYKRQKQAVGPPTPPLSSVTCPHMSRVNVSLLPVGLLILSPATRTHPSAALPVYV